jgi:hypothetical protein
MLAGSILSLKDGSGKWSLGANGPATHPSWFATLDKANSLDH